jgi:ABC-2 type transport system ATP-binding protein
MGLNVIKLTGGYNGVKVIDDISFNVNNGEIVALIGLNGAGKSTTINHIIGILKPISGTIFIDEDSINDNLIEYKKHIAYIPESPVLYEELTLREHLQTIIYAYHLDEKKAWADAQDLLKTFRLDNKLDWFPTEFSKGMKQKVMLVSALMADTDFLIVDEPFLGLDPLAVADLIEILKKKKKQGTAILLTTHVLSAAEKFADSFILLANGKIRAQGNSAKIKKAFPKSKSLDDIYGMLAEED